MGSDPPPSGQKPPVQPAPQSQSKPQTPQQRPPQQRPQGQPRPSSGPQKPKYKYGENKSRAGEFMSMPFVFLSFMFGLANMLAVPVIYVYEILKNNEKDEWPAWSGFDGLNYLFFEKAPLFIREGKLFKMEFLHPGEKAVPIQLINLHIPALTEFVNTIVVGYLNMAVAFICFVQGAVFLTLATRIAIRALDKPQSTK